MSPPRRPRLPWLFALALAAIVVSGAVAARPDTPPAGPVAESTAAADGASAEARPPTEPARPGGGGGGLPAIAVTDAGAVEGNAGTTTVLFTISASGNVKSSISVSWATSPGTASTPSDFVTASGVVTFAKRVKSVVVSVTVVGDTLDEPDETFSVVLSGATGATISDGTGNGAIIDDDAPPAPDPVIATAGDIACDPTSGSFNNGQGTAGSCKQRATSDLLLAGSYDAVLTLGDNQYEDGTTAQFVASYDPSWGRVKAITRPSPGNHDYHLAGASGYYGYFGSAAGDPTKGYYSYDLGTWHLIALNSNCAAIGGCGAGSAQERWLRADLAATAKACILAYWHHPRFSSGTTHGSSTATSALYQALYDARADIVLAGHEHQYERFGLTGPTGAADPNGIRNFVVGTGGKGLYTGFGTPLATSQVRDATSLGILELTLRPAGYDWRFVRATGSLSDAGSGACH